MKYYARESGFGQQFESVVAGGLAEFCNRMENPQNALWTAVRDSEMFGSVAVDGEDIGDGTEVRAASSMIKLTRSARVGAIWAAAGPTGEATEVTGHATNARPSSCSISRQWHEALGAGGHVRCRTVESS